MSEHTTGTTYVPLDHPGDCALAWCRARPTCAGSGGVNGWDGWHRRAHCGVLALGEFFAVEVGAGRFVEDAGAGFGPEMVHVLVRATDGGSDGFEAGLSPAEARALAGHLLDLAQEVELGETFDAVMLDRQAASDASHREAIRLAFWAGTAHKAEPPPAAC